MKIISLGDVNFKLIYVLIGGFCKLAQKLKFFFFDEIKLNAHPFIAGINAGLGMSLAFIPGLILKYKLNNRISIRDEMILFNKKKKIMKKIGLIFLCCFFDFMQKILVFLYKDYVVINLWIFDIVFLGALSFLILKLKLYKHQYFSCFFMIIFGIIMNAINYEYTRKIFYPLLLIFAIEISYTLGIVLSKYLMDSLFMTPYQITYIEGIFELILNIIFLLISTNNEITDNSSSLIKSATNCEYEGKKYVDNFYAYLNVLKGGEIVAFIILMIYRVIFNLFGLIIAKDLTPSHVIFLEMIGGISLAFEGNYNWKKIITLFIIFIEIFFLLIFTEIIELNFWKLNYNTKRNIKIREKILTESDSKSDDSGDIGGIELPDIHEDVEMDISYDNYMEEHLFNK